MATKPAPSATVVFEDPPPTSRYDWDAIATKLKAQPNQWGKVFDHDKHSLAVSIRQAKPSHPLYGFEQETRNTTWVEEDGKRVRYCALYLRYIPPTKKK